MSARVAFRCLFCVGVWVTSAACSPDNKLTVVDTDDDGVNDLPQIEVTPDELYYSVLPVGSSEVRAFTVTNRGDGDLEVSSITVQGASGFTLLTTVADFVLAKDQSVELNVEFSPGAPEERATVHIASNDVGNPDALVSLEGYGEFPELLITPDPLSFGRVLLGCSRTEPIYLLNTGNAALTISTVAQIGDGFEITTPLALPLTVAAGEQVQMEVTLTAEAEVGYSFKIWVTSTDTVSTQSVTQTATGTVDAGAVEDFWQGDGPWDMADILFYVDQSCSMLDNQQTLRENFSAFAARLDSYELDWQVMVATKDDGCANHGIFHSGDAETVSDFVNAVGGRRGDYTEAGLTIASNALRESTPGGCNEGFLREDSKTVVILVSDETEQSTAHPWNYYVDMMNSLTPNLSITAIVGDVPAGCETAQPGNGYYEASIATGGAFLSICANDWAPYFDTIATISATGQISTFVLHSEPNPDTIEVSVDDLVSPDAAWQYDGTLNAVVFADTALPAAGAHIRVSYDLLGDCEG